MYRGYVEVCHRDLTWGLYFSFSTLMIYLTVWRQLICTSSFADDTNLSCEGKSSPKVKQKLDVDLDNVHNWLMANKLTLNKEKAEYMIVGSRQKLHLLTTGNSDVTIGEQKIKRVQMKNVLEVIIDDQLKWDKHNDEQCRRI